MIYPNFNEERKLKRKGYSMIAGLDESGRGPLAGPVIAAAVVMRLFSLSAFRPLKIKDSKKLNSRHRKKIFEIIKNHPEIEWAVGRVSEKVIDKINILEATKLAMERAVKNLENKIRKKTESFLGSSDNILKQQAKSRKIKNNHLIDFLIIDGNFGINLNIPQKLIIKADEKVFSCVLASIVAKVVRDEIMLKYHKKYPQYGFDRHKGYPVKVHKKLIKKYGLCKIHRKTFKTI